MYDSYDEEAFEVSNCFLLYQVSNCIVPQLVPQQLQYGSSSFRSCTAGDQVQHAVLATTPSPVSDLQHTVHCVGFVLCLQPSHDLRELASAQLRSMFQVLSRLSTAAAASSSSSSSQQAASTCRACVYARRAESLGAPQIRLQRVACWPGAAAQQPHGSSSSSSYEEMDDVLTLQRPAWEAGSGSSGTCDTEASLCQEDVLLLPNSNMIVLPLAEANVLVGLLVVEVPGMPAAAPSSSSSSDAATASPWDPPSSNSHMGLPEDALWCFRMAVPPLAKACAMDLRAALAGAQQEAQQRLARSLLLEAQGPLKVLGTFGQMLAPRLRTELAGQPESDMADGMVMQGQRLADVVAQLEAALRPQAGSRGMQQQQQLALPAAAESQSAAAVVPGMGMTGIAYDSFDDIEDCDLPDMWHTIDQQQVQQQQPPVQQQQQQLAKGLPSGVTAKAGYLPEHVSSSTAPSSTAVQQSSVQQQELPHLPGQGTAGSLGSSSRDIRWGRVEPPAAVTAVPSSSSSSSSRNSDQACSASYSVAPGQLDMQKTIDLEVTGVEATLMSMDVDSSSSSSSATVVTAPAWVTSSRLSSSSSSSSDGEDTSSSSSTSRRSSSSSRLQKRAAAISSVVPQPQASCNLIDAIGHLLTAAANLAKVEGKNFIVTPPLQLDQPVTPLGSSSSSMAGALLPRPIRPLLVGLAASTCRRVLGYVLDVALQCTPRGGQLCVTARESSGGVELSLLHTGQVKADRVHTTSKALSPAIHNTSSSSSSTSAQQPSSSPASPSRGAGAAAADAGSTSQRSSSSSRRSRRVVQELSSSGSSRSSSSSLVSLDFAGQLLQEIGGRLAVVYPIQFMNAVSGNLEVGSSIEVWLPPPAQGAAV
jgi:hypothetical protein